MHRSHPVAIGVVAVMLSSFVNMTHAGAQNSATTDQAAARSTAVRSVDRDTRGPARPATSTTGWILGTAWRGDKMPFPHARIRLRDVKNGRSVALVVTDSDGGFRFDTVEPGAYVVELLGQGNRVLATGDLFGVSAGMESTTVVRLSTDSQWFGGLLGNAAAGAIAAASTLGVTATGSNGRPASAQ